MKKKIISICITLFIFLCSVVPTFALDTVINSQCEYWLYDLMLQTVNNNTSNATWGYVLDNSSNPIMGYYAMVLDANSSAIYEYNVKPGDTVYFRWGVSNFYQSRGTTSVKTVVNGSVVNTTNYTVGSGDFNSGGSVFICDDYTNTSNVSQTVTFSIRNEMADFSTTYLPVKVGIDIYFNSIVGEVSSDAIVDIDLSYIEETMEIISDTVTLNYNALSSISSKVNSIYTTLSNIYNSVNLLTSQMYTLWEHVPIEFSEVYGYFLYGLNATFTNNFVNGPGFMRDNILPFIAVSGPGTNSYSDAKGILVKNGEFYFSFMFQTSATLSDVQAFTPTLNYSDGTRVDMDIVSLDKNGANYTGTYRMNFVNSDRIGDQFSIYLGSYQSKFIPIYIGYPFLTGDISEIQMAMSGIGYNDVGSDRLLNSNINDFNKVTSNLEQLEKTQLNNLNNHLNNIPTLDFNAFNDFAPTVQFVSGTLQQIYQSNAFLQLLINVGLVIGIALLIIGRKT